MVSVIVYIRVWCGVVWCGVVWCGVVWCDGDGELVVVLPSSGCVLVVFIILNVLLEDIILCVCKLWSITDEVIYIY